MDVNTYFSITRKFLIDLLSKETKKLNRLSWRLIVGC